jgi:hypothetical protein
MALPRCVTAVTSLLATPTFVLRPASTSGTKAFQFLIVGVSTPADIAIGKATWGVNETFGGPKPMLKNGALPTAPASSGDFVSVVGVTGVWSDKTSDGVTADDSFLCLGISTSGVNIS